MTKDRQTVLAHYAYTIIKLLIKSGYDEATVLTALNFPHYDELHENQRITRTQFIDMCHQACAIADDPLFCLKAGYSIDISDFPLFGGLVAYSQNFGEAFQYILRYQHLLVDGLSWSAYQEERKTNLYISSSIIDEDVDYFAPLIELRLGLAIKLIHLSTPHIQRNIVDAIHLQHMPRGSIEDYRDTLNCNVFFNKKFNQVKACFNFFDITIYSRNDEFLKILLDSLERKAKQSRESGEKTYISIVSAYLENYFLKPIPSLEKVSQELGLSVSTLKRKLKQEGSTFQELAGTVKYKSAEHYLKNTSLPMNDISTQLGFASTSSFTRFFKRFTGKSPLIFRKSLAVF